MLHQISASAPPILVQCFILTLQTEVLSTVLPVLGPPEISCPRRPPSRPELLAPPYRVATNPGQDEQEADGQAQKHHNDDEQRDAEAS